MKLPTKIAIGTAIIATPPLGYGIYALSTPSIKSTSIKSPSINNPIDIPKDTEQQLNLQPEPNSIEQPSVSIPQSEPTIFNVVTAIEQGEKDLIEFINTGKPPTNIEPMQAYFDSYIENKVLVNGKGVTKERWPKNIFKATKGRWRLWWRWWWEEPTWYKNFKLIHKEDLLTSNKDSLAPKWKQLESLFRGVEDKDFVIKY